MAKKKKSKLYGVEQAKNILSETVHFVGRGFKRDPGQAKRFSKAHKSLRRRGLRKSDPGFAEAATAEALEERKRRQKQRARGTVTAATLSPPPTQLG